MNLSKISQGKMINVNNRFLDDLVVFTTAGLAATLNSES